MLLPEILFSLMRGQRDPSRASHAAAQSPPVRSPCPRHWPGRCGVPVADALHGTDSGLPGTSGCAPTSPPDRSCSSLCPRSLAPSWGGDGGGRVTITRRPPQPGVGLGVFSTASERALRINGNENEGGRADPTPRSRVRPPAASPGEDASARLVPGQAAAGGNARPGRRGR